MKISVIGAGNVGATCALKLAEKELAEEVVLVDIVEGIPQGKSLDMWESAPIIHSDTKMTGTNGFEETKDSEIVIITAGLARKPGMSRDDLIRKNTEIVSSCAENVAKYSPNSIIIVVSNPLDAMTLVALKKSGFPSHRVFGMAGILDTARFRSFIALETKVSVDDIFAMVLGGHGDTMVPLPRYSYVGGIPLPELIEKDKLDAMMERTRKGGGEIVALLKTGSAYYAPASAAVEMAESIVKNKNRILPCCAWLTGQYGLNDIYMGVPVKLGKTGIVEVIELKLTPEEQEELNKSAEHVRRNAAELDL